METTDQEYWVNQSERRRLRNKMALDLYEAALQWRAQYFRTQMNPEELRTDRDQLRYDMCLTDFGDDAFNLLMDHTEPHWWNERPPSSTGSP